MQELSRLEHMSKEQREAYILAMKLPATATEEERQRFELLRQIALGRKLTDAEREAIDMAALYQGVCRNSRATRK